MTNSILPKGSPKKILAEYTWQREQRLPRIVIVGGGAGGLELATKLGKKLGKRHLAQIILVDSSTTHIWKPLLHEVAAGTLDSNHDALPYLFYANHHHFEFCLGTLDGLDRMNKTIKLASIQDEARQEVVPDRNISYDILVLSVGSSVNDFATPGVKEHCFFLDRRSQSNYFHQAFIQNLLRLAHQKNESKQLPFTIAVVGGGATGVELIAELHYSLTQLTHCGLRINPEDVSLILIEAAERILAPLHPTISNMVSKDLQSKQITLHVSTRVCNVTSSGLYTQLNEFIPANMIVWSAGIKAPDVLAMLDNLEVNRNNQLLVKQTLQTTLDETIFAFGDCASCPQGDNTFVPARAQAAHQQASFLVRALGAYLKKKPLPLYWYNDYGSLISLGQHNSVGHVLTKNKIMKGKIARFAYWSLYKMHQTALHGAWRVALFTIANILSGGKKQRVKLH